MPERDLVSDDAIGILAVAAERVSDPAISDEERQDARASFAALAETYFPYRRDWRSLVDSDDPPSEARNEKARWRDTQLKFAYLSWAYDDRDMAALGKLVTELHQWTEDHTDSSSDAEIIAFPVNDNWGDGTGPEATSSVAEERPPGPLTDRPAIEMDEAVEADEPKPTEEAAPTEKRNAEMTNPETPTTDPGAVVVTAVMARDKDTKNTVRYAEAGSGTPAIGTIYLPKHSIDALGNPETITVTVSVA